MAPNPASTSAQVPGSGTAAAAVRRAGDGVDQRHAAKGADAIAQLVGIGTAVAAIATVAGVGAAARHRTGLASHEILVVDTDWRGLGRAGSDDGQRQQRGGMGQASGVDAAWVGTRVAKDEAWHASLLGIGVWWTAARRAPGLRRVLCRPPSPSRHWQRGWAERAVRRRLQQVRRPGLRRTVGAAEGPAQRAVGLVDQQLASGMPGRRFGGDTGHSPILGLGRTPAQRIMQRQRIGAGGWAGHRAGDTS